ncbi:MAG: M48 family metalloprotease, partial [Phycisphaerae bacterium]|nr:M48 family metalloprotease [Phycisphaerae bacterium]
LRYVNPLYWLLCAYGWFYNLLGAKFSRQREYMADAFACQAYGSALFGQSLVAVHVESDIFNQVALPNVVELLREGKAFHNVYHFVGGIRGQVERESVKDLQETLAGHLRTTTGWQDSHPSLADRLRAAACPEAALPGRVRPIADAELDEAGAAADGQPSAAEDLFGAEQARQLQRDLTNLLTAQYDAYLRAVAAQQQQAD